jgi:hypothetical protein
VDNAQLPPDPSNQPIAELEETPEPAPLPRWVQVIVGVVLLPFTLLCVAGAASIFGIPKVQADPLLQLLAALICLLCVWAVALAFRLLFGIRGRYGLMGPATLRVIAVGAVGLIIAGFFTGVWVEHPVRSGLLSISYILVAIRLWQLAAHRQAVSPNKSFERTREG